MFDARGMGLRRFALKKNEMGPLKPRVQAVSSPHQQRCHHFVKCKFERIRSVLHVGWPAQYQFSLPFRRMSGVECDTSSFICHCVICHCFVQPRCRNTVAKVKRMTLTKCIINRSSSPLQWHQDESTYAIQLQFVYVLHTYCMIVSKVVRVEMKNGNMD